MAITGTVAGYVVVVFLPSGEEEERRCSTVEGVDEVMNEAQRLDAGMEFYTLVSGPDGLEREEGFARSTPPGSVVYRTTSCPGCGKHGWWPHESRGSFSHTECVPQEDDFEEDNNCC